MRLTLSVELQQGERQNASHIKQRMKDIHPHVETRFVTDKAGLAERITDAMKKKKFEHISTELEERLQHPSYAEDCLDTLCSVVFFSSQRVMEGHSSSRFTAVIARLPEEPREKITCEIVKRAMAVLSNSRRLDCSRTPLLSYAETLACMVKADLLSVESVVTAITQMIRLETTRTAGMSCLGKLVEVAFDMVRSCDAQIIGSLYVALTFAQQGDSFLYDVEYIMGAFGWSKAKSPLSLTRSGVHHKGQILAMTYNPGPREIVVTSSIDGNIGTWDGNGMLMENIVLSRHYASTVDLGSHGNTLYVGAVGRNLSTPPAVILYNSVDAKWSEASAVEPAGALFITAVRSMKASSSHFCIGAHTREHSLNPLLVYDRQTLVSEFCAHTDILTALHVPADNDHTVITGSRDTSVVLYDLRAGYSTNTYSNHNCTVTAIATHGDLLFTAGLDKKVLTQDLRMGGTVTSREMDSAVLALSVSNTNTVAVSTLTGIHVMDCTSGLTSCSRVDSGLSSPRYNTVTWNHAGSLLYAGGDSCMLDLFSHTNDKEDGEQHISYS